MIKKLINKFIGKVKEYAIKWLPDDNERHVMYGAVLTILVVLGILLARSGVNFLYIQTGIISKSDTKVLIENFENEYLYKNVFNTTEYKIGKDKLLKEKFILTKKDLHDYFISLAKINKDKFTYFLYDSFNSNTYSKVANKKTEFNSILKDDKYLYIRFNQFQDVSSKFKDTIDKNKDIPYLIIDLRGNPGGNESEVLKIADYLLPKVEIEHSESFNSKLFYYSDEKMQEYKKIYIYLDKDSASCSEVLALSLKENLNDKVVLIGKQTYYKGVGQHTLVTYNHIKFYIVNFRWYVNDKTVIDLNKYLETYKNSKLDNETDFLSIVQSIP